MNGKVYQNSSAVEHVRYKLAERNLGRIQRVDMQLKAIEKILSDECIIGKGKIKELTKYVHAEIFGAGVLQHIIDLPNVTDVVVNAPNNVWFDAGFGMQKCDEEFPELSTKEKVREFAFRLVTVGGQRLDNRNLIADSVLPTGVRVHAVLEPLCDAGAVISLRVPHKQVLALDDLIFSGTVENKFADLVKSALKTRKNILISGGTGSGKTTLLTAFLNEIDPHDRILCLEETREINLRKDNIVSLVTEKTNVESGRKITLRDLVIASLRMRPDRIVIGECRGPEIKELLMALNTGHTGSISTVHANSVSSVPSRIEMLCSLVGIAKTAVAQYVFNGIDYVFHMQRNKNGERKLSEVGVMRIDDDGKLVCERIESL